MNYAQTVDPYKVWSGFAKTEAPPPTAKANKRRTELMSIILNSDGPHLKEISDRYPAMKRTLCATLARMIKDGWLKKLDGRYYVTQPPVFHVKRDDDERGHIL